MLCLYRLLNPNSNLHTNPNNAISPNFISHSNWMNISACIWDEIWRYGIVWGIMLEIQTILQLSFLIRDPHHLLESYMNFIIVRLVRGREGYLRLQSMGLGQTFTSFFNHITASSVMTFCYILSVKTRVNDIT